MEEFLNMLELHLTEVLTTAITVFISYIIMAIKNIYNEYVNNKIKKDIVSSTVQYVEQTCDQPNCIENNIEKFNLAKSKALEWLNTQKIKTSDTELEILIESAVLEMKKT